MINLFNTHPKKAVVYAITKGKFLGELFVFIEQKNKDYMFLSLPDMHIRTVPSDKFKFGLKNKIIDVVERLPKDVFGTCVKQYRKNIIKAK